MPDALDRLGSATYVSLTTFRRSGEPVSTPVWLVRQGQHLLVWTPAGSGKVKRLRNDARVRLVPCGRLGKVKDGEQPVDGTAELLTDPTDVARVAAAVRRRYGLEARLISGLEGLFDRGSRERVGLRIDVGAPA